MRQPTEPVGVVRDVGITMFGSKGAIIMPLNKVPNDQLLVTKYKAWTGGWRDGKGSDGRNRTTPPAAVQRARRTDHHGDDHGDISIGGTRRAGAVSAGRPLHACCYSAVAPLPEFGIVAKAEIRGCAGLRASTRRANQARTSSIGFIGTIRATRSMTFLFPAAILRS